MLARMEVVGTGNSFSIMRDGEEYLGPFGSRERAFSAMEVARKKDQRKKRACLSCGTTFESEGNHNRLCSKCRNRATHYMGLI